MLKALAIVVYLLKENKMSNKLVITVKNMENMAIFIATQGRINKNLCDLLKMIKENDYDKETVNLLIEEIEQDFNKQVLDWQVEP